MKKPMMTLLVLICTLSLLLSACGGGPISKEKAQSIALKDMGVSASDATVHVHVGEHDGEPCYSVYVTANGKTMEYLIDSESGEILEVRESNHKH